MKNKTFTFYVHTRGDRSVGIPPVDDVINVTLESGDPGGDDMALKKAFRDGAISVKQGNLF